MESIFAGAVLLLGIALFGAWQAVQAFKLAARSHAETRRVLRLAGWNLLEPLISTIISFPVGMWGIAWSFNCGMNGTRGCHQILMALIFLVPFISPFALLVVPVLLQRARIPEPWQTMKSRVVNFGLFRFALLILVVIGFFVTAPCISVDAILAFTSMQGAVGCDSRWSPMFDAKRQTLCKVL